MSFYRHLILLGEDAQWLAKKLNVSHQTIYNWKNKKSKPSPKRLKKLAAVLGVPMEKIYKEFY